MPLAQWFDDIVNWWQDPKRAPGKPYTHGQRLNDWTAGQSCNQIDAIIKVLALDSSTSRGIAILVDPGTDKIADKAIEFPCFSVLHLWVDENELNCSVILMKPTRHTFGKGAPAIRWMLTFSGALLRCEGLAASTNCSRPRWTSPPNRLVVSSRISHRNLQCHIGGSVHLRQVEHVRNVHAFATGSFDGRHSAGYGCAVLSHQAARIWQTRGAMIV